MLNAIAHMHRSFDQPASFNIFNKFLETQSQFEGVSTYMWWILVRAANWTGMVPDNWFWFSCRCLSLLRAANSLGMRPVNWFMNRIKSVRLVRDDSSLGIAPVKWFLPRYICRRSLRAANSVGIVPVSWLSKTSRIMRPVRVASSLGIVPVILLLHRYLLKQWYPSQRKIMIPSDASPLHRISLGHVSKTYWEWWFSFKRQLSNLLADAHM